MSRIWNGLQTHLQTQQKRCYNRHQLISAILCLFQFRGVLQDLNSKTQQNKSMQINLKENIKVCSDAESDFPTGIPQVSSLLCGIPPPFKVPRGALSMCLAKFAVLSLCTGQGHGKILLTGGGGGRKIILGFLSKILQNRELETLSIEI